MPSTLRRLNPLKISRIKTPGMHADGGGLYLQVTPKKSGIELAKSWIFRFKLHGKTREMGLGSLSTLGLADARKAAEDSRKLLQAKTDPIAARDAQRAAAALQAARSITFKDCAGQYIAAHRAAWRNRKHAAQWGSPLEAYAYPVIGAHSAQAIDTGLVLRVLEPIWSTKPETASRLRGRIEAILDWARARGIRDGDNPARWRGHLDQTLPAQSKVRKVRHHRALPYADLPEFMARLRGQKGIAARSLEFTILTVARTDEVIRGRPDEINRREKIWTVPADRMKAGREHRVPLSARAVAIVTELDTDDEDFFFPGAREGRPQSNMAMLKLLARMGLDDVATVHGFRSTFRDWAAECTNYARDVVEMALAHAIEDKTEAAYRRGDLFEKRRRLMDEWARYCARPRAKSGNVVQLRSKSAS